MKICSLHSLKSAKTWLIDHWVIGSLLVRLRHHLLLFRGLRVPRFSSFIPHPLFCLLTSGYQNEIIELQFYKQYANKIVTPIGQACLHNLSVKPVLFIAPLCCRWAGEYSPSLRGDSALRILMGLCMPGTVRAARVVGVQSTGAIRLIAL